MGKIRAYLDGNTRSDCFLFDERLTANVNDNIRQCRFDNIIDNCYTKIKVILPNGFEYWYVENFQGGVGESKWYR